jgi:hypothetical protein
MISWFFKTRTKVAARWPDEIWSCRFYKLLAGIVSWCQKSVGPSTGVRACSAGSGMSFHGSAGSGMSFHGGATRERQSAQWWSVRWIYDNSTSRKRLVRSAHLLVPLSAALLSKYTSLFTIMMGVGSNKRKSMYVCKCSILRLTFFE